MDIKIPYRVLLIVPPVRLSQPPGRFPFGLAYVAGALERAGKRVEVLDLNILRLPPEEEARLIVDAIRDVDVVGTGGMITMLESIGRIIRVIKSSRSELPVMTGGTLASQLQGEILKRLPIDVLVVGEGEDIVADLVDALVNRGDLAEISGVAFLDKGRLVTTSPRPRIANLDDINWPAYHLFDFHRYISHRKSPRTADIIGSRGCPFHCSFCFRNFGNQVFFRSVKSILEEVSFLKIFYDIQHVHLEDELFVQRDSFVSEFCQGIKVLGVTWSACARANTVNPAILTEMKDAGCIGLMLGLESFSDSILKEMGKGVSATQNDLACQWCNEVGIQVYPGLIIGMIGETEATVAETVQGIKRNNLKVNVWQYAFATPYPGTKLYSDARRQGIIPDEWEYVSKLCRIGDTKNLTINLSSIPDRQLVRLRDAALTDKGPGRWKVFRSAGRTFLRHAKRQISQFLDSSGGHSDASARNFFHPNHFKIGLSEGAAKKLFKATVSMVEIEIFSFCNRTCWFCPNSLIDRKSKNIFMKNDIYHKILLDLASIEYSGMISYSRYNEPLADNIIYQRVREARTSMPGALLHLNTNGDYLNRTVLDRLHEAGLNSLNIQIYLPNGTDYSDQAAARMMRDVIARYGLEAEFAFSRTGDWLEYRLEHLDMHIRLYARNFYRNGADRGGILDSMRSMNRKRPCSVPFTDIYIDYNGSVVPCCNIRSDFDDHKDYVLGTLDDPIQNIFSIYSSINSVIFRTKAKNNIFELIPCRACSFIK